MSNCLKIVITYSLNLDKNVVENVLFPSESLEKWLKKSEMSKIMYINMKKHSGKWFEFQIYVNKKKDERKEE